MMVNSRAIIYFLNKEKQDYHPWTDPIKTETYTVEIILHHGALMTKKMKIASMQAKKIEKQLEFEMQINALLGTDEEEQIDEF